jgi:2-keto-3-deoxy-6-phosphogluconate aldolase
MSNITVQSIVEEAPIIAILRRPQVDPVRCIEHLFQNGIRLVEITMDTPGAIEVLKAQCSRVPANALLGAGHHRGRGRSRLSGRRNVYSHSEYEFRRYSDST